MAFNTAVVTVNAGGDGYELHNDLLLEDGTVVAADADITADAGGDTDGEFHIDLLSVDSDGAITVTAGASVADSADAEAPDVPEDEIVLATALVEEDGAAGVEAITEVSTDRLGEDASVSADESHVA